ncbi:hypothetical protein D3C80_1216740 [compost metagenome]
MGIPHIAFNLRLRHQCRHGVNDNNVYCTAAHKCFSDLQRLFSCIRLGQQKFINVDAKRVGIFRVERMFRIDEGSLSANLLYFSDSMQGNRCFTGRFRSIYFYNTSFWKSANTQGNIKCQGSAWYNFHFHVIGFTQFHDRTFTKLFFYLTKRHIQRSTTI